MEKPGARRTASRSLGSMGQLAWSGGAQVLSSASNVVIALAVARGGGNEALGAYSLAFSVIVMVWAFQRSLILDPMLSLLPREQRSSPQRAAKHAAGSVLVFLLPISLVASIVGIIAGNPLIATLGPVILLTGSEDAYRYYFFAIEQPRKSATIEGTWLVVSLLAWPLVSSTGSPTIAIASLGAGGAAALIAARVMRSGMPASLSASVKWWTTDARPLGGFLALDTLTFVVTNQVAIFALAAMIGLDDLGELRAAQILLGPASLALVAVSMFALPRISRAPGKWGMRQIGMISALATVISIIAVATAIVLGPLLIDVIYGESFSSSRSLLWPVGSAIVLGSTAMGPSLALKARMRGAALLTAALLSGFGGLAAILIGARFGGLLPASWGYAVWAAISSAVVWRLCRTTIIGADSSSLGQQP